MSFSFQTDCMGCNHSHDYRWGCANFKCCFYGMTTRQQAAWFEADDERNGQEHNR